MNPQLTIEIRANIDQFKSSMLQSADVIHTGMSGATANVDQFSSTFDRATGAIDQSVNRMAGKFEAANDRIVGAASKSSQAIDSINTAAEKVDTSSLSKNIADAISEGFSRGDQEAHSRMDSISSFVENKLVIVGIAIVTGISALVISAFYAAYKVVAEFADFASSILSGKKYTNETVDGVIALTKEVTSLQDALKISADHASALNEALKGAGVGNSAYVATLEAATKAAQTNTEELDRLGIKYKASNGQLLSQQEILKNVKTALDEYTEGYDRNEAAAAIGIGSYKAISDALSITTEKTEEARQKLADYHLIIGPGTQEAATAYEKSMAVFNRENELMALGFKKAVADVMMPILTDLADYFKDGFPAVVTIFRSSMATLLSYFYSVKDAAVDVAEGVKASFRSMADVVSRVGSAMNKASAGDVRDAWKDLASIPDDVKKRWNSASENIAANSIRNAELWATSRKKAIALALGADSYNVGSDAAAKKTGKNWHPAKGLAGGGGAATDPLDTLLENYRREAFAQEVGMSSSTVKEIENLGALLKVGKVDAAEYNKLLDTVLGKDSVLAREQALLDKSRLAQAAMGQSVDNLRDTYQRQTALYDQLQMTAPQRELEAALGKVKDAATAAREALSQKAASLEGDDVNALEAFRAAIVRVNDAEADQITKITALQAEQERLNGLWETGADRALTKYLDSSINVADQVEAAFTKGFQGMEDALMTFVSTGKLSFADLAKSIIADLARIELKAQLRTLLPSSGDAGGLLGKAGSWLANLFGGSSGITGGTVAGVMVNGIAGGPLSGAGLHSGGIAGIEATFMRNVSPDLFARAPRFHTGGIAGNEVPAILRKGEGVFTPAQMQALGKGGMAGGAVTINVHLNGPSDNAAEVRRSAGQGARSAWNALQGSRRYV